MCGFLATYTPGISERRSTGSLFYSNDVLGSPRFMVNASSNAMTDDEHFDAFGMTVYHGGSSPTTTPYGFVGKKGYQTDTSGLMLLGHRYYDAGIGRFLSRDPIHDGSNWYAYCGNNPLDKTDPTGLDPILALKWATAAEVLGGGPEDPVADLVAVSLYYVALQIGVHHASHASSSTEATTPTLDQGRQDKHTPGHPNHEQELAKGKNPSRLTHKDPQGLLNRSAGKGTRSGQREHVDFGEHIGEHVNRQGVATPTTRGTIHYNHQGGAHIVPAPPEAP